MKVANLVPGMLLRPIESHVWVEVPWKGSSGDIVGSYLDVINLSVLDSMPKEDSGHVYGGSVLYLGTSDEHKTVYTPGRQVVLAFGKKMTVNSYCWPYIEQAK
jgi:hypothetical protein